MIKEIQLTLKNNRNSNNANQMMAYMKDRFSFLGIKKPLLMELSKSYLSSKFNKYDDLMELVNELWEMPEREFQYLAMEFLYRNKKLLSLESVVDIESLITSKSWWDTVDGLASNVIGLLLKQFPDHMKETIAPWIDSNDIWLNRTAIIFQLKYKQDVNEELLICAIVPHVNSTEFFHAKAIGWALRQYSKFNPAFVRSFLAEHQLQPLSMREASKYL